MFDRDDLQDTWQRNEAELSRLYSIKTAIRELYGPKIDDLEQVQDRIEFYAGVGYWPPGSVRWSGMP
jgi:hypothetical protein